MSGVKNTSIDRQGEAIDYEQLCQEMEDQLERADTVACVLEELEDLLSQIERCDPRRFRCILRALVGFYRGEHV